MRERSQGTELGGPGYLSAYCHMVLVRHGDLQACLLICKMGGISAYLTG